MTNDPSKRNCVKCDAADVVAAHWFGFTSPPSISLGMLSAIPLGVYICCTCGFTELFIENKEHLAKIREHAQKEQKPQSAQPDAGP
jgi:hypothetical protein